MTVVDLVPRRAGTGTRGGGVVRGFRPDIEALRALAVTLVVANHADVPGFSGGYIGVDVFFVISGYLITRHLHTELLTHGRIKLADFYARRIRRLLPLATLVTLSTVIAAWLIASPLEARRAAKDALWATLFAMNIHLANTGVDYQADQDPSLFQHYWSLAIEEQFYLAWPLLLTIAALAWLPRRRTRGPATWAMAATITAATAASFAYGLHQTDTARALAYFTTPSRAWELGIGGLIAITAPTLARTRILRHTPTTTALTLTGLGTIIATAILYTDATPFPGTAALIPTLATATVITAGLTKTTPVETHLLNTPIPQGLGRISYGIYLWHWPILILTPAYLDTTTPTPTHRAIAILLTLWLAVVSYPVVEVPFRRVQASAARHRRTLGFGAAAVAASLVLASAAAALVPDARGDGAAARDLGAGLTELAEVQRGAAITAVPSNLTPALEGAVRDEPGRAVKGAEDCHANLLESEISDSGSDCVFGDPNGTTTVVLTGDSHAYQWLPALDQLARTKGWRLVSMTKAACALYDVTLENQTLKRDYRECYTWRDKVTARIAAEKESLVITTGAIFSSRGADFAARWATGVGTTVRGLMASGSRVVVLEDVPYPGRDIPKCLAKHLDRATSCTTPINEAMSDPARRAGTREQAAAAGAIVIDPTPWFCTSTTCAVVVGNTLVHRDNSHVTATYARALVPRLEQSLPAPFGTGATS